MIVRRRNQTECLPKAKGSRTRSRVDQEAARSWVHRRKGSSGPALQGRRTHGCVDPATGPPSGDRSPCREVFGPCDPGPERPRAGWPTGRDRRRAIRFGDAGRGATSGAVSKGPGGLRVTGSDGLASLRADRSGVGEPPGNPAGRARRPSGNLVRGWRPRGNLWSIVRRVGGSPGSLIRRVTGSSGHGILGRRVFGSVGPTGRHVFG